MRLNKNACFRTRDGRLVNIVQNTDPEVIRCHVHLAALKWEPRNYPPNGIWNADGSESNEDLIEVPCVR